MAAHAKPTEPARRQPPLPHVWQADLRQSGEWIEEAAASTLGTGEGERRTEEPHEVWRRRVVARAALRIALGRRLHRPPASLAFAPGPGGKPRLAGSDGPGSIEFNLAHSGDVCLIAISEAGPIGVDVEEVCDFPELEGVAETRFAPSEAAAILERSGEFRLRAFYRCWTRKEAYLKATGAGLEAGLESVVVSVGDRPAIHSVADGGAEGWSLLDLDLDDGFVGAAAIRGPQENALDALVPAPLPLGL